MTGTLFPFLFVTIACGACSGFHGLVCSGTTSKQVDRESHIQPVGYGAMLAEGFVALIALVDGDDRRARPSSQGLAPGTIYGNGIGRFLTLLIGRGEPALRHHLRRDGVLDLRLRHARRLRRGSAATSLQELLRLEGHAPARCVGDAGHASPRRRYFVASPARPARGRSSGPSSAPRTSSSPR